MFTIKKYPNRRLYDTRQSRYVNLEDIKAMILEHEEFQVVDSKTGEDITKTILLQIISEQESSDQQSLLTNMLLMQLIRYYETDMQVFLRQYLEDSMSHFMEQQEGIQRMLKQMVDVSPLGVSARILEENFGAWTSGGRKNKKKE